MPAIIALVLAAIVALTVLGFVLHVLFSPWLLVAVAIVAWIKFRPSLAVGPARGRGVVSGRTSQWRPG